MLYFSIIKELGAVFFCGLSIKLMDDYLDQDLDKTIGKKTLAIKLGRATLPYALLSFSLAMALDNSSALSLFWASYILGMGYDYHRDLPTGLKSYQESIIVLLLGIYFLEIEQFFSALSVILIVQLIDDLIDLDDDRVNRNNFVYILGKRQVYLLVLLLLVLSVYFDFQKTLMVFLMAPLIIKLLEDKDDAKKVVGEN